MDTIFEDQTIVEPIKNTTGYLSSDKIFNLLVSIITVFSILIFLIYKGCRPFSQRYFFIPSNGFRDTISKATDSSAGLISKKKIGIKSSSFRRRLIMGSLKPQLYSTLPLNSKSLVDNSDVDNTDPKYYRLRVSQIDRLDENKSNFLRNIKPILPNNIERKKLFGFFHPFSYTLGGGEKVLWEAVISTLENNENNIAIIYTFTPTTKTSVYSILKDVNDTFGINFFKQERENLRDRIVFIHLPDKYQWLINGNSYKFLSIIGQAIGSIILVFLGFYQLTPDIFIDTIGIPFSYSFIFGLLDIPIISYIHYPTISKDMLNAAKNLPGIYGIVKFTYWWILLKLYSINIMFVNIVLFNSTWTGENVKNALTNWVGNVIDLDKSILYPPCVSYDDENFDKFTIDDILSLKRENYITYLAQFRPEKRHKLLINHYKEYLNKSDKTESPYKLVLIGSVREGIDEGYINELEKLVKNLEIPSHLIIFELNASTEIVHNWLKISDFGINCMWKEHFGISVVEYMLNGAIPLCHASAGPLEDIVVPRINGKVLSRTELKKIVKINDLERSGLFFKDKSDPDFNKAMTDEYPTLTEMLLVASNLNDIEKSKMRENAVYVSREKFGKRAFSKKWTGEIFDIVEMETDRRISRGKVKQSY